jgi:ubiquinone/menaquinone biosynthesis C-methylase UbiE
MAAAAEGSENVMNDRLMNASQADRLDNPERLLWLPPAMVIGVLAVQPGNTIADIGAGTGYFSLPLAQAIGPLGQVYAVDSQAEMLGRLQYKLDTGNISNIRAVLAEAGSTGLPNTSCDLVFMANVWHEFAERFAVLSEAKRLLKSGGQIAVLDWRPDVEPEHGPPLHHRISATDATDTVHSAGFIVAKQSNIGKYSWLVQGLMQREIEQ